MMERKSLRALAACVASVAVMSATLALAAPTQAAQQQPTSSLNTEPAAPGVGEVAGAVAAAGALIRDTAPVVAEPDGFSTHEGDVTLPPDAGSPVVVEGESVSVEIGLPGDATADAIQTPDGIAYQGAATDTTVVARPGQDGSAQILAVLGSSDAPTSLSFTVSAGDGASLVKNEDGSVTLQRAVTGPDGAAVQTVEGIFTAPWAVDADGRPVATSYEVRGMALVQTIQPDADTAFPVTADPTFATGWTGLFVHWKENEVKWLAGLTLAGTGAALASLCAGPQLPLCAGAAASVFYALNSVSNAFVGSMYDRGYRLTTRLTPFFATYWEKR